MTAKIWYIHGANATRNSFNYIKTFLGEHKSEFIEYITVDPLYATITDLVPRLQSEKKPVHIIGHSLGGLIAVSLAQRVPDKVASVTTLATPFAGSGAAAKALMVMPFDAFLQNASSFNPTIYNIRNTEVDVPLHSFITTRGGNSMMREENDGVVTVQSQLALNQGVQHKVPLNHFEVLISEDVALKIVNIVQGVEKLFPELV